LNGLFSDVPSKMLGKHNIFLQDEGIPVGQSTRRFPFRIQRDLRNELTRLERLPFIEPVTQPTPWFTKCCSVAKEWFFANLCRFSITQPVHPTADENFNRMQCVNVFLTLLKVSIMSCWMKTAYFSPLPIRHLAVTNGYGCHME
jgi:hypothetical protein